MFKVGETVRYGRTGTVGKIVAFMEERGILSPNLILQECTIA